MNFDTIFVRRALAPLGAPYRDALVGADNPSAERIAKVPLAEVAEVRIVRERSNPQMRLYRACCAKLAEGIGETPERVHNWNKLRTGFYDLMEVVPGSGKYAIVLESTAFDRMSADRFADYFQKAQRVWREELGVKYEAVLARVEEMLGNPPLDETATRIGHNGGPALADGERGG